MSLHTNHLINETSPYLLQHAHNPVNWHPWGDVALELAKTGNKPILVSIGYSACHWCHVMERESFEDEATAKIMNDHFINIKIDREERPDLDHIYMDAVQAMTGSGGWPLNVFLTPDRRPFYGGTYFPPVRAFNRSSWKEILLGVSNSFNERRHEIDAQAKNLTDHLLQSNGFGLQVVSEQSRDELFSKEKLEEAFTNCMKNADTTWGGFGNAPKFPQTLIIRFLLQYYFFTKDENALKQALLSIDKMIEGGIYDQLGGGFARYATDTEWLVPHFEKMLYDNALLVNVMAESFQLTGNERYKEVIDETIECIKRDLMDDSGGFYSALDADSEGEEGKFYVRNYDEVKDLLGDDAGIFCMYYDITSNGNWEGKNILRVKHSLEEFAADNAMDIKILKETLKRGGKILLQERDKRVLPGLDDKIILGWNALMNTACSKAFAATGNDAYRELAIANMKFLLRHHAGRQGKEFHHTWKNGQAKFPAFLDDYAFLIQALIHLQEITADLHWLEEAKELAGFVIVNFSEEDTGFFFYTREGQHDVIVRKKEVYDGATPSGNSVMAGNLHYLSIVFDRSDWAIRSSEMVKRLGKAIFSHPTSFGYWAAQFLERVVGTSEIAVIGKATKGIHEEILRYYIPNRVIMVSAIENQLFPFLAGKKATDPPSVYVCKNFACLQPVISVKEVIALINSTNSVN